MENPTNHQTSQAPFNMAIATLMRLNEVLNSMKLDAIRFGDQTKGGLSIKHSHVTNLFIQAAPLLGEKGMEAINKIRKPLQERIERFERSEVGAHSDLKRCKGFSHELDDLAIMIQRKLQEDGFFMPPSKDPRRAIVD